MVSIVFSHLTLPSYIISPWAQQLEGQVENMTQKTISAHLNGEFFLKEVGGVLSIHWFVYKCSSRL